VLWVRAGEENLSKSRVGTGGRPGAPVAGRRLAIASRLSVPSPDAEESRHRKKSVLSREQLPV
jgi:hypothetical protein